MKILVLLTSMILSGCASRLDSNLDGKCYVLTSDQHLWKTYDNSYVGKYILTDAKKPQLTDEQLPLGKVSKGSQVIVNQVLSAFDGSWGRFLRIQVQVVGSEYDGLIADIPTCSPYHPRPPWVVKGCSSHPDALQLKPEYLKKVQSCGL